MASSIHDVLKREISGRGVLEVFVAITLAAAIVSAVLDKAARSEDLIAVGILGFILLLARINPDRTAAWRERREQRHASRPRPVYTARKRRAAAIAVVIVVYFMIRPDRQASLVAATGYSLVFSALVLVVLRVRMRHLTRVLRRLTGRSEGPVGVGHLTGEPGSSDTDAFGRSRRDR